MSDFGLGESLRRAFGKKVEPAEKKPDVQEPYVPLGGIASFGLRDEPAPIFPLPRGSMAWVLQKDKALKARQKKAAEKGRCLYAPIWQTETLEFEDLVKEHQRQPLPPEELVARQLKVIAVKPEQIKSLAVKAETFRKEKHARWDVRKQWINFANLDLRPPYLAHQLPSAERTSFELDANIMLAFSLADPGAEHGITNPDQLDTHVAQSKDLLSCCPWGDGVKPNYQALSLGLSYLVSERVQKQLLEAGLLSPDDLEKHYELVANWMISSWIRGSYDGREPKEASRDYPPFSSLPKKDYPALSFLPYAARVFECFGQCLEGNVPDGFNYNPFTLRQYAENFFDFVEDVVIYKLQRLLKVDQGTSDLATLAKMASEALANGKIDPAEAREIETVYNQMVDEQEYVTRAANHYVQRPQLLVGSRLPSEPSADELERTFRYPHDLDGLVEKVRAAGGSLKRKGAYIQIISGSRRDLGPR